MDKDYKKVLGEAIKGFLPQALEIEITRPILVEMARLKEHVMRKTVHLDKRQLGPFYSSYIELVKKNTKEFLKELDLVLLSKERIIHKVLTQYEMIPSSSGDVDDMIELAGPLFDAQAERVRHNIATHNFKALKLGDR